MLFPKSFGLSSFLVLNSASVSLVSAFPTVENLAELAHRSGSSVTSERSLLDLKDALLKITSKETVVGLSTGPVDVSGDHAFSPPDIAGGDQRGPCPGLNALANHGYIPHSGITSLAEAILAASSVLGMGADVAGVLSILATIDVGNPLSLSPGFSIGGRSKKVSNLLGDLEGLLSTPEGLDGSHNLLEVDSSGTRDDLYVTGDSWTLNLDLFKAMLDGADGEEVTLENSFDFAKQRFDESVSTNPYFYHGPVTGMLVRNGGFILPKRIMSNFSAEFLPDGQLTKTNLMSFYGVVEENGEMVYKEGYEQIPANFYRRPIDYNLVNFNLDAIALVLKYPELGSIGGNLGEVNSFAGVDLGNVTGGVVNALSLQDGNNMICLVLEVVRAFVPKTLSKLFSIVEIPLQLVDELVAPIVDLGCPVFPDMTLDGEDLYNGLLSKFPGAKKSGFAF